MSRAVYEVAPIGGGWLIRMPGDSVSELRASKADAIARARELGGQYDEWRVRVLGESGDVETELSSAETAPS